MNQEPRHIKRTCAFCKKNTVYVTQLYDPHISDYYDIGIPICDECKRKSLYTGGGTSDRAGSN